MQTETLLTLFAVIYLVIVQPDGHCLDEAVLQARLWLDVNILRKTGKSRPLYEPVAWQGSAKSL